MAPVKPSARVQQSYLRCFPSSELQRLPPIFCIGLFCLALLQTTQTFKYSPCPARSVPSWPRGTAQQTPRGVQEQRGTQRGDFADLFLNLRQIYTELLAAPRCTSSHFPNHAELNLPFLLLRRERLLVPFAPHRTCRNRKQKRSALATVLGLVRKLRNSKGRKSSGVL